MCLCDQVPKAIDILLCGTRARLVINIVGSRGKPNSMASEGEGDSGMTLGPAVDGSQCSCQSGPQVTLAFGGSGGKAKNAEIAEIGQCTWDSFCALQK